MAGSICCAGAGVTGRLDSPLLLPPERVLARLVEARSGDTCLLAGVGGISGTCTSCSNSASRYVTRRRLSGRRVARASLRKPMRVMHTLGSSEMPSSNAAVEVMPAAMAAPGFGVGGVATGVAVLAVVTLAELVLGAASPGAAGVLPAGVLPTGMLPAGVLRVLGAARRRHTLDAALLTQNAPYTVACCSSSSSKSSFRVLNLAGSVTFSNHLCTLATSASIFSSVVTEAEMAARDTPSWWAIIALTLCGKMPDKLHAASVSSISGKLTASGRSRQCSPHTLPISSRTTWRCVSV
mmetsp:Transcript_12194/g.23178  ORF Transcript_12194/g.23178 Transcript_12194/m.23178 type:complete len:295 (-) Transcript_12194:516-1400(-)